MNERGLTAELRKDIVNIHEKGHLRATAYWQAWSYVMKMRDISPDHPAQVNMATSADERQLWHERFGHQDKRHVRECLKDRGIDVDYKSKKEFCDGCAMG